MAKANVAKFKPGDVVEMVSGGPRMTVNEVTRDGEIMTLWFDVVNVLRADTFRPSCLRLSNPKFQLNDPSQEPTPP